MPGAGCALSWGGSPPCPNWPGRPAVPEDIAAAETAAEPVISLQAQTGESGLTLEGMLGAGDEEEGLVERLTPAGGHCPNCREREQQVLLLRYYRGMTQVNAARGAGGVPGYRCPAWSGGPWSGCGGN